MDTPSTSNELLYSVDQTLSFDTLAVHAGTPSQSYVGAVIEPICLSTNFAQFCVGDPIRFPYTRSGNPNRENLENAMATLEQGRYALMFSSGMAAISTVLQSLAPGSHVISVSDVYGGTYRYFTQLATNHGVTASFTLDVESDFAKLVTPNTRLVWIETPSNPTLKVTNITAVASAAHRAGVKVAVDNTLLSPYIQNPLKQGADIVVHSVSKYINGHSDVLMGAVIFNDPDLYPKFHLLQKGIGAVPSPFDCWLAHRGMKTLHLRAQASSSNASAIANLLQSSPYIISVNYPGLKSHPNHRAVLEQHRNGMGGGMLSFRIKDGRKAAEAFCQHTCLFTLAVSLGGVESLVEIPSLMTHSGIPAAHRHLDHLFDDLIRLSCGIESSEDLCEDVLQALEKAVGTQEHIH